MGPAEHGSLNGFVGAFDRLSLGRDQEAVADTGLRQPPHDIRKALHLRRDGSLLRDDGAAGGCARPVQGDQCERSQGHGDNGPQLWNLRRGQEAASAHLRRDLSGRRRDWRAVLIFRNDQSLAYFTVVLV